MQDLTLLQAYSEAEELTLATIWLSCHILLRNSKQPCVLLVIDTKQKDTYLEFNRYAVAREFKTLLFLGRDFVTKYYIIVGNDRMCSVAGIVETALRRRH
jgi:hypothetical protein